MTSLQSVDWCRKWCQAVDASCLVKICDFSTAQAHSSVKAHYHFTKYKVQTATWKSVHVCLGDVLLCYMFLST